MGAAPLTSVAGSDSADTHYCVGYAVAEADTVFEAWRYDERWKGLDDFARVIAKVGA